MKSVKNRERDVTLPERSFSLWVAIGHYIEARRLRTIDAIEETLPDLATGDDISGVYVTTKAAAEDSGLPPGSFVTTITREAEALMDTSEGMSIDVLRTSSGEFLGVTAYTFTRDPHGREWPEQSYASPGMPQPEGPSEERLSLACIVLELQAVQADADRTPTPA